MTKWKEHINKYKFVVFIALIGFCGCTKYVENRATDRAAWMQDAKWGVMNHYLADWIASVNKMEMSTEQWNKLVDGFDVEGLADQVKSVGAGYYIITIGQNSGYYLAPNPTYDRLTGISPGKCSKRDLVSELSAALAKRGIKLIVYLPAGAPGGDRAAREALQWHSGGENRNREFQLNWEAVISDWSRRWGDKIVGWWFDGCYWPNTMYRFEEKPNYASFAAAARAGNPNNIVAFNPGVVDRIISVTPYEDYSAGEINDPNRLMIRRSVNGKMDGTQVHVLSFLGEKWGMGAPRFTTEQVVDWSRKVRKSGGVITWDVPIQTNGLMAQPFMDQLTAIGKALRTSEKAANDTAVSPVESFEPANADVAVSKSAPDQLTPAIRTPAPPAAPRLNGPSVFGVRPGHPLLYRIPATGKRPMEFAADGLPSGLKLNSKTGQITGSLSSPGQHSVTLRAKNALGAGEKKFKIVVGETIALTPPMGWNSWNAYHATVTGDNVIRAARAMVSSGLNNHGWSYINIDDAWQDKRGGQFNGIQPNEKFPDMQKMCDEIHALGLKVGIYSTPWTTSYARYIGGSSDDPNGAWTKGGGRRMGTVSFAEADARQWAVWGIDYLKYDWNPKSNSPRETPEQFHQDIATMAKALRDSGRDVVFSYSNSMPFEYIADVSKMLTCWRTTGDIGDSWRSMSTKAFYINIPKNTPADAPLPPPSDKWAPYAGPGHWNDPDMMVLGVVNFGNKQHPTRLTPDEQYLHMTQWCMVSSPLLLGCDLEKLDAFTLNLITNDEVLAVNQDALGKQATLASNEGNTLLVYVKDLEDGSKAVALYNLSEKPAAVTAKWSDLKISGKQTARDLWRQKNLGRFDTQFQLTVASHGAEMVKIQTQAER